MTRRILSLPVTFGIAKRKVDGSVKIEAVTLYEVSTDDFVMLDTYRQSSGWLMFAENKLNEEDIPQEDVESDIAKSQSTQLRDVLWVLYKAKGNNTKDKEKWNLYYRRNMQSIKARVLDEVHKLEGK